MPHDDAQQDPVPTVPAVQQAPAVPAEAKAASPPEAKAETAAGIARPNSMGQKIKSLISRMNWKLSAKQLIQGYQWF